MQQFLLIIKVLIHYFFSILYDLTVNLAKQSQFLLLIKSQILELFVLSKFYILLIFFNKIVYKVFEIILFYQYQTI